MPSARSLFQEILDHDEPFRLFCSIAAGGEAQGGWENGRIAALVPPALRALAPKIARHATDEDNRLAYTREELLRLAAAGHGPFIRRTLRTCALAEIRVHRDVSLAVMARTGRVLGRPRTRRALLTAAVHAVYAYERLAGRRRMVTLGMPERLDALGGPTAPAHE
ncbi:hypothetical protein ACNFR7_28065 [Streptomyces sp. RM1]|uniref:hypothetical protein n=1 Tax=Streptomyces misionensis TaxID=67331 RepID=UPI00396B5A34